ncbi:MAG: OmpA family protein [Deltaproteobacteria bacterium]|nr:OmpA family protein [Deltaproteobacteria bacterium]
MAWRAGGAGLLCGLVWALASACGGAPPVPVYEVASRGGDRDEDGAADIDDGCPDEPEDGLPPKANDGCPARDPDQDGIAGADDKCPDAKEDGQPPDPSDGCPTTDSDGDGVADAKDGCPDGAEDNLPPEPGDGCPSPDRDQDGVADAVDRCPDAPETPNGYRDEDGCPDELPAASAVAYDEGSSTIYVPETRKIDFALDSAELTPVARETIAEVARVLSAHPEIARVEIEGHASSKGEPRYNAELTERRARAVAGTLAQHGIASSRLVPIGYGELCPAIDRGDDVDEPRNRRVLLKAVVVSGVWQNVSRGCWRAKAAGIDPTRRRPGGGQAAPSSPSPGMTVPASGGV